MDIENTLCETGFNKYENVLKKFSECYIYSYQLCVRDSSGNKKYFIDADLYDYNKASFKSKLPDHYLEELQIEFSAQLNTKQGETFDVKYFEKDVDKALEFYENMFQKLDLEYYEEIN